LVHVDYYTVGLYQGGCLVVAVATAMVVRAARTWPAARSITGGS
jgi:hypothetical protein